MAYDRKFHRSQDISGEWQVNKYLHHQGHKFINRFDAISYVKLTEQIDSHDIGRSRGGVVCALQAITAKVLVMGIDSDMLYPIYEQIQLADGISGAVFATIESIDGHDGFLLEHTQVVNHIESFFKQ